MSTKTLSQVSRDPEVTAATGRRSVCPKSCRDEVRFPCIFSGAIPRSPSNTTNCLTSFRQLQRFPENTIPSLEEHKFQQSNSRKAPCTQKHLEMRADSLASIQEECQLSTSTSRGVFSQLMVCERNPEFAASSGTDTEMT